MKVTQRAVIEACHGGVLFATMAVCLTAALGIWAFSTLKKPVGVLKEPAPTQGIHLMTTDELPRLP